jgi:hypothetical protein
MERTPKSIKTHSFLEYGEFGGVLCREKPKAAGFT